MPKRAERREIRCPNCGKLQMKLRPHAEQDIEIFCARCKCTLLIRGMTIEVLLDRGVHALDIQPEFV